MGFHWVVATKYWESSLGWTNMHWAPIDSIYIAHASVVQKKKNTDIIVDAIGGQPFTARQNVFSSGPCSTLTNTIVWYLRANLSFQKQTQMHVGRMLGKSKGQWQDYQVCLPWPSTKSATILEQSDPMKFQKSGHQAMRDLIILYLRPHQKKHHLQSCGKWKHWSLVRVKVAQETQPAWTSWALGSKGGASGRWQYL